jgi:bifunctional non-homologous end joining protein LigD
MTKCDVLGSQTSVRMPVLRASSNFIHHAQHLQLLHPDQIDQRSRHPGLSPRSEVYFYGYRLRLERDGDRVRLITKGGYNWTSRYPWIVEAALKNRFKQFVLDGEAVVLGIDGVANFNALHSRKHDDEVQFYAFDILALGGEDLHGLPLSMRKTNLARLLARRPDGIFVAPCEQGEIGPDLFRAASRLGLESLGRNAAYFVFVGAAAPTCF